jgi:drug/metabolite transporter (DMT)-like permease
LLGFQRTIGDPSEIYVSNYTRLHLDMSQQREELLNFEQSMMRPTTAVEIVPSYDLSVLKTLDSSDAADTLKETSSVMEEGGLSDLWKARLLLIGAAALYGTNFSLVKLLGDIMPVGVSTSLRFGAAALVTLPWLLKDARNDKDALMAAWLGFEVGLWNSIGYVSQAVGLDTTPAAESAFICSLAVVTVPILDFCAGRPLQSKQWVGAFLAVLGVAFLELVGEPLSGHSMSTGDLLTLVQPFAFGIGFWRMDDAMNRFPTQASRMTASQLLAIFMASLAYGGWALDLSTLHSYPWAEWMTDPTLLFSIFWTGVITTAMTIYMENKAMETLSAAETTLIFSTEPLWGSAFAALVMGDQLGPNVGFGAAFIFTACIYSNLGMEGLQKLWQGSVSSVVGNQHATGRRNNGSATMNPQAPISLQRQWTWFSLSAATSWAWWKVAVPNIPTMDDVTDVVEEGLSTIVEKIL